MSKIAYVCRECGSSRIWREANLVWSVEDQAWVTLSVMQTYCERCGQTALRSVLVEGDDEGDLT